MRAVQLRISACAVFAIRFGSDHEHGAKRSNYSWIYPLARLLTTHSDESALKRVQTVQKVNDSRYDAMYAVSEDRGATWTPENLDPELSQRDVWIGAKWRDARVLGHIPQVGGRCEKRRLKFEADGPSSRCLPQAAAVPALSA